jgi:hypothetical protein
MLEVRTGRRILAVIVPIALASCSGTAADMRRDEGDETSDERADIEALAAVPRATTIDACAPAGEGTMRCRAKLVTDVNRKPLGSLAVPTSGLGATDLRDAYKLPASGGQGRLVVVVAAFDDPNAETDLNTYRAQYGIAPCTSASGCFQKLNQNGQPGPLPPADTGWAAEIALDLEMVSAACPDCTLALVEAQSSFASDLGAAVLTAAQLGPFAITNSYGGPENDAQVRAIESNYNQPGILVVASSGDDGYDHVVSSDGTIMFAVSSPASLPWVVAAGGTTLTKSVSTRGWAETVWSGSGSGCSSRFSKPTWQMDTGCTNRTVADVAAVANPATGVAFFNGRWSVIGGTSVSAPLVAGIFALLNIGAPSFPYLHPSAFFDVTSGNNGVCGNYQCMAQVGYDGPTGVGTPNGTAIRAVPVPTLPAWGNLTLAFVLLLVGAIGARSARLASAPAVARA